MVGSITIGDKISKCAMTHFEIFSPIWLTFFTEKVVGRF